MDFDSALEDAALATRRKPTCSVALWRAEQTEENQAKFDAAIGSSVGANVIHRAMKSMGYAVNTTQAVRRHRNGECACGRLR